MKHLDGVECRTCKAWDLFGEGFGFCRRKSPAVHMLNPQAVEKSTGIKIMSPLQGLWPVTGAGDYCGDHQPILNEEGAK